MQCVTAGHRIMALANLRPAHEGQNALTGLNYEPLAAVRGSGSSKLQNCILFVLSNEWSIIIFGNVSSAYLTVLLFILNFFLPKNKSNLMYN